MRILVVSDLPQYVTGGAEMQAGRLIRAWLDAGHEVRCLGRRMGTSGSIRLGPHVVPVGRIWVSSALGRWGRAASYFVSLAWLLFRHRRWADVVYTRFLGEAAATGALLKAARVLRVPLVATPANTRGNGDTNLLRSLPLGKRLIRLLDRHCDAINLIAEEMVVELRSAGFSGDKFTRIPNGIPLGPMPDRQPSPWPRMVAVGRLAPQKGYDLLLQALAGLRETLHPGQVVIVGDGPERDALKGLARQLQLAEVVEFRGELSQSEVSIALASAEVFLLPSRYEGLSNAGLEAMERGMALVLSACGGLDRHVGPDMGWVVPPSDVGALAHALENVVATDPSLLADMGRNARLCVEREFDMDVVAQRYLELFERLRERRGLTRPSS